VQYAWTDLENEIYQWVRLYGLHVTMFGWDLSGTSLASSLIGLICTGNFCKMVCNWYVQFSNY